VGTTALGWILCVILLGSASVWLAYVRPWNKGVLPEGAVETLAPESVADGRRSP
jgi:hypothetical protein